MSGDRSDGRDDNRGTRLSAEMVDEIKWRILFGDVDHKGLPVSGQFRKGQSGNPKGRPKEPSLDLDGDRSANALVLKSAERPVTVREGDEHRQVPAIDAVLLAQRNTSIRGNAYARKHYIERYGRAERERRAEDAQRIAEDIKLWTDYKTRQLEAHAEAQRKGEPPPTQLPHPDDDLSTRKAFDSWVRRTRKDCVSSRRSCDTAMHTCSKTHLMSVALIHRAGAPSLTSQERPLCFFHLCNDSLPKRLRLTEVEAVSRMSRYRGIPKRQLLKETYAAWRFAGAPARRGMLFPPLSIVKAALEKIGLASEDESEP